MFVKKKSPIRSNEEWFKLIDDWKSSQKGVIIWCQENGIPDSTFRSAYKRLFPDDQKQSVLQRSCFQELKETNQLDSGIEFSFQGITVRLSQQFDEQLLLSLLKVLRKLQ